MNQLFGIQSVFPHLNRFLAIGAAVDPDSINCGSRGVLNTGVLNTGVLNVDLIRRDRYLDSGREGAGAISLATDHFGKNLPVSLVHGLSRPVGLGPELLHRSNHNRRFGFKIFLDCKLRLTMEMVFEPDVCESVNALSPAFLNPNCPSNCINDVRELRFHGGDELVSNPVSCVSTV